MNSFRFVNKNNTSIRKVKIIVFLSMNKEKKIYNLLSFDFNLLTLSLYCVSAPHDLTVFDLFRVNFMWRNLLSLVHSPSFSLIKWKRGKKLLINLKQTHLRELWCYDALDFGRRM